MKINKDLAEKIVDFNNEYFPYDDFECIAEYNGYIGYDSKINKLMNLTEQEYKDLKYNFETLLEDDEYFKDNKDLIEILKEM